MIAWAEDVEWNANHPLLEWVDGELVLLVKTLRGIVAGQTAGGAQSGKGLDSGAVLLLVVGVVGSRPKSDFVGRHQQEGVNVVAEFLWKAGEGSRRGSSHGDWVCVCVFVVVSSLSPQ